MSIASTLFPLFVLIILSIEFVAKSLFEAWVTPTRRSLTRAYIRYRATVFVTQSLTLGFMYELALGKVVFVALILTLCGSTELIAAWLSEHIFARTGRTLRPLHLLYAGVFAAAIVLLWRAYVWLPGPAFKFAEFFGADVAGLLADKRPFTVVLVYFFASVPTNYIIRWLLNKPEDPTFPDMLIGASLPAASRPGSTAPTESTAPSSSTAPTGPSLRGGRIIGVLERWIVIVLLSRGEIGAIGFVFTAKSIVRYHDFTKPDFAEYYLIGTLYSVVISLSLNALL